MWCPFPILGKALGNYPFQRRKRIFVYLFSKLVVRAAGLEPARPYGLEILSLVRLPFRQARTRLMLRAAGRSRFRATSAPLQDVLGDHLSKNDQQEPKNRHHGQNV